MKVEEWLGQENQLGADIWNHKYRYNGESFDQWLDRISGGNQEIRQLVVEKKFLFGGRILSNRGLEHEGRKVSLSNCYVITPPGDDIVDIFECAKKLARTYSYGGGCGRIYQSENRSGEGYKGKYLNSYQQRIYECSKEK